MEAMKIRNLYNLEETIAAPLLEQYEYPWEVLPYIKEFIKALGNALPEDRFEKRGEDIWVAKSATVAPTACLNGPCIVDEEAEIRHCAFVRGSAIIGKGAVVGNSTEAHMGAGSITSNVKSDKTLVVVKSAEENIETGLKKFGAMLGDCVEVGCNSVLNPGTVIGRHTNVYPLSRVRGFIPENSIFKDQEHIVLKEDRG